MNTAPILQLPTRLAQLESQALEHKEAALSHWQSFVTAVLEIQTKALWPTEQYADFNAYCKARFGVGASRIRQYKAALPYAELIESETGIVPTEKLIRDCREAIAGDNLLLIPTFQAAMELAPKPQLRHFKAAYEVLRNGLKTGSVSVSGISMPFDADTTKRAMKQEFMEVDIRYSEHLKSNAPKQRWVGSAKEAILLLSSKFASDKAIVILYEDDTE